MGLLRMLVAALTLALVIVPVVQLAAPMSSTVMYELTAKSAGRVHSTSRVPAVAPETTAGRRDMLAALGTIDAVDHAVALPGFALDSFVPPRA